MLASMIGDVGSHRSNQHAASITIGMPVFNAAATVVSALNSVLHQDFVDLRVIVSDNASEDGTGELVQSIARQDDRVQYVRQGTNLGAYRNFNFVLGLASTPYFAWAASDDTQDPDYFRRCIEVLESHPEAVFCHADADETITGKATPFVRYEGACGATGPTFRRYLEVHRRFPDLHVYGVFRTSVGQKVGGMDLGPSGDIAFCRKMALEGPFCYAKDTVHHRVITESWKSPQASMRRASTQGKLVRPSTHLLKVSRDDLWAAALPVTQRGALVLIVTAREGIRRLTVLVVGLMGKAQQVRRSRGTALRVFRWFFGKGNYVVLDDEIFLQRIVWPVLRWNGG